MARVTSVQLRRGLRRAAFVELSSWPSLGASRRVSKFVLLLLTEFLLPVVEALRRMFLAESTGIFMRVVIETDIVAESASAPKASLQHACGTVFCSWPRSRLSCGESRWLRRPERVRARGTGCEFSRSPAVERPIPSIRVAPSWLGAIGQELKKKLQTLGPHCLLRWMYIRTSP